MSDARVRPVVLLVEDNPSMRTLLRSLAESARTVVAECADGESALTLYQRIRPDWVLMDIKLGGMDGIAATRAIRHADPTARVVIVTELDDEHHRRAAREAGASGYVLKQYLLGLPGLLASGSSG